MLFLYRFLFSPTAFSKAEGRSEMAVKCTRLPIKPFLKIEISIYSIF